MGNISMYFKRRIARPEEFDLVLDLIEHRFLIIKSYTIFRELETSSGAKNKVRIRTELPFPMVVESRESISDFMASLEKSHAVFTGDIVLIAEADVADLHKRTIQFCRIATPLSDIILDEPIEEEESLVELLERTSESTIESLVNSRLNAPFEIKFSAGCESHWNVSSQLIIPYFEILIPPREAQSIKESTDSFIRSTFNAEQAGEENGHLLYFCYSDEGPYANTISDAKLATEKYLGSKIKRQLEMFGLRDFTIRFYITGSH